MVSILPIPSSAEKLAGGHRPPGELEGGFRLAEGLPRANTRSEALPGIVGFGLRVTLRYQALKSRKDRCCIAALASGDVAVVRVADDVIGPMIVAVIAIHSTSDVGP